MKGSAGGLMIEPLTAHQLDNTTQYSAHTDTHNAAHTQKHTPQANLKAPCVD